ncbi:MAG: alanine racemase, partial [Lachnospiraceae bacterium]|nr:alanine racemase [Lachnospiraceae bacterium]
MDKMRICAEIDISAIKHNIDLMYSKLSDDMKLYMVIKADGYGHGALPIAEAFEEDERVEGYAVATVSEGIELREGGIKKDILILGV